MNNEKKTNFYQRHKRAIWIIAGVVAASFGAVYIFKIINLDPENEESSFSTDTGSITNATIDDLSIISDNSPIQEHVSVREHYRTLPEGCHPSVEKQAEAESLGIPIPEGKTFVNAYIK
ncbi:hypothetical protein RU86_GL000174 [Lactococcus piscium]|uniref:Uncharacterized protein n=1 Tax=Pseudolactococcus piscium TaxID=1364 RepID=A0A2A5S648_9LACT|nr:hypothetical protein [Lactococcus piscium]PCS08938.1 hypothetical protein RU86_GL000174 [Lactococcus piscium]